MVQKISMPVKGGSPKLLPDGLGWGDLSERARDTVSKLFKLKEWLTVKDAARHLSTVFGEPVSEGDVLRIALDGQLTLSVYFVNHASAIKKKLVLWKDADRVPSIDGVRMIVMGDYWDQEHVLVTDAENPDGATTITGVFDLTMRGAERLDVEHRYQQLTDGPEVTLICLDGAVVQSLDGTYWGLRDSFDPHEIELPDGRKKKVPRTYYPAGGLPDDSVLVVRSSALQRLIASLDTDSVKPLSTTERNSLLKIVIGMAIGGYGYDPKAAKSPVPKQIMDDLASLGVSIDNDTVRNHLREAARTILPASVQKP